MKKIIIKDEEFNVEDTVHDLLFFYSRAVQITIMVRQAQKEYFKKQDQTTLRIAKALEKKLDNFLDETTLENNQKELF